MEPPQSVAEIFQDAVRALRTKDWSLAEAKCRQVLLAEPSHVDALHMLGHVLKETNRLDEAIAVLKTAADLQPDNPILWTNLGVTFQKAEKFAEAVECQRRAVALQEAFPETHYNLGLALRGLGQHEHAVAAFARATELRPNYAAAHFMLGNLFREEGQLAEAVSAYQHALEIRPDWRDAHLNIAATWLALRMPANALEHYQELLRLDPDDSDAEYSLGHALRHQGRIQEAKAAYVRAAAKPSAKESHRSPVAILFRESLAELIAPDQAAIELYLATLSAALDQFVAQPGRIDLANLHLHGAIAPNTMLAYYGSNVRPIMERYAEINRRQIAPCRLLPRRGKPKLGIVVTHAREGVFARCWGGIAERLSRELFEVRLICSRPGDKVLQSMLNLPESELLHLPARVDEAARLLQAQEFDWLHYWEIGTDPMNYYLPFFRAAHGQSGNWGWPVTSGNPLVNAYLSCEQLEPAEGPAHYTERLILLKHLPTFYVPTDVHRGPEMRSRFGLQDGQHIYFCTQNLLKFHPDFDPLLAGILRNDVRGELLIIANRQQPITEMLLDRFRRTMPDVVDRVRVMPRMERPEYLALVELADVMLDTLHYGGGANTVYDAVAVGTPIVTLPGDFQRGRWAMAVNRRLGLPQLIASTPAEYVSIAVEVTCNRDWRESLRRQILAAGADLFEDQATVREHEEYFSQAIADGRAE